MTFDKLPHNRLIIVGSGIKGAVKAWIDKWLINRKHNSERLFFRLEGMAQWCSQGLEQGLLQFSIYFNDWDLGVEATIYFKLYQKTGGRVSTK